jgi:hypothetical protein
VAPHHPRRGIHPRAGGKVPPHGRGQLPGEPPNGGMFLLLNLAVGGQAGNPPDSTHFPADLMVDYVRVTLP